MIAENIPLAPLTTMRTGGRARYFFAVRNLADARRAMRFAARKEIPVFFLGGGSNIVVGDDGFSGLVVKNEMSSFECEDAGDAVRVIVGGGMEWDAFVERAVRGGWHGVENLSLIPGTVGAAPVQNIGAYGSEVSDTIEFVEALHAETRQLKRFSNAECGFGYRKSFFRSAEGEKYFIVRVSFLLKKNAALKTNYPDIKKYFSETQRGITLRSVRDAVAKIRTDKLPDIAKVGTAGSFFKNPVVTDADLARVEVSYPGAAHVRLGKNKNKLSAAWLIEHVAKMKGVREGDVGVYDKHALVLVNHGTARADEIKKFSEKIERRVFEKTGIRLEKEILFVE